MNQVVWIKILKGDEHLEGKSGSAIQISNSEMHLRVINHRTTHIAGKANEVTSFGERIKDSSPAKNWNK